LVRETDAPKVLDIRNVTWASANDGLCYSLGNRYTRVRPGFFIATTLQCMAKWTLNDLPLIIVAARDTPNDTLRFAIWAKFPDVEIETKEL
jgi:hypothetical protein